MATSLEVINNNAVLLHLPEEKGISVRVLAGAGGGDVIVIDASGHIRIIPVNPAAQNAVNAIVQGIQGLTRLAGESRTAGAGR
ncbi:MAG TPA: hypothetical protein VMT51_07445 [Dongiaceae bacterium]|nr:hypothetical protein [Dongiaceae bacterium]